MDLRFVQVALGLWHVHSKNILHRDLKTQNIFITKGELKQWSIDSREGRHCFNRTRGLASQTPM